MAVACAKKDLADLSTCLQTTPSHTAGSSGAALVFSPDPGASADSMTLSPTAVNLDDYRTRVELAHLGGMGILQGQYVDVLNGMDCNLGFNAYDPKNQFLYTHADRRFQEAMAYYDGDLYRSHIDNIGYLVNSNSVRVIAHCMLEDNAFYFRSQESGQTYGNVCLGDSQYTPGASYADDAEVTVHELEHASTTDAYDLQQSLNQLWYDEAGAMNEAVSDFMALSYIQPLLPTAFDPRTFSRWALGNYIPNSVNTRGAQKCPTYDSQFANNCSAFPAFSGANNTISYVYPDGVGWPYSNNFTGPNYAANAFATYTAQEEIHNAGVLLEGALWDVYDSIRTARGGDSVSAQSATARLVLEAVKHLPKPTTAVNGISPVTFRGLAQEMVDLSSDPALGLSSAEQSAVSTELTARGLYGGTPLPASWAEVGPGSGATPGMLVLDNPAKVKSWLAAMGADPAQVTQGVSTGLNGQLDPGETVALWFDIGNTAKVSAGGINITVTTPDGDAIQILDGSTNIGSVGGNTTQIQYAKIYGSTVASELGPSVPVGTSYFKSNPLFQSSYRTAVWVRVNAGTAHGRVVTFHLDIRPSNGAAVALDFPAKVN
jgi:hypothetical protein